MVRQADRKEDGQTDRQADRQTDRQTDSILQNNTVHVVRQKRLIVIFQKPV